MSNEKATKSVFGRALEYSQNIHRKKKEKKAGFVSDSFVRWIHPAALQSEETVGEFVDLTEYDLRYLNMFKSEN